MNYSCNKSKTFWKVCWCFSIRGCRSVITYTEISFTSGGRSYDAHAHIKRATLIVMCLLLVPMCRLRYTCVLVLGIRNLGYVATGKLVTTHFVSEAPGCSNLFSRRQNDSILSGLCFKWISIDSVDCKLSSGCTLRTRMFIGVRRPPAAEQCAYRNYANLIIHVTSHQKKWS